MGPWSPGSGTLLRAVSVGIGKTCDSESTRWICETEKPYTDFAQCQGGARLIHVLLSDPPWDCGRLSGIEKESLGAEYCGKE